MAAKSKTLLPGDRTFSDIGIIRQELTKVRCWVSGYEAGCNSITKGVPGSEGLRLAIMLLDDLIRELPRKRP